MLAIICKKKKKSVQVDNLTGLLNRVKNLPYFRQSPIVQGAEFYASLYMEWEQSSWDTSSLVCLRLFLLK